MLNQCIIIVDIDDIVIYSDTLEKHVEQVQAVLQHLIKHQLYTKVEKCKFHQTSTSFLGYIISSEGVAMDEGKVQAVLSRSQSTRVKELQQFLGFANFYWRFIRNFSTVAVPLTSMTKRGNAKLCWSADAIQAFEELMNRFTSAPILHHLDPNVPFVVDSSNTSIGAIHNLIPAECNYDMGNRELLAMKAAFEQWRHWLEGAKHLFLVLTDHCNLENLHTAKRLNPRQARWALSFTRFNFSITYCLG